jgi:hypothetical protein
MKFFFALFAVASSQAVAVRNPLEKLTGEVIRESLTNFLEHIVKGDCKNLKLNVSPMAKNSLNTLGEVADDLGNMLGKDNPVLGPMIMMGKQYIVQMGNGYIDTAVNDHMCDLFIHNMPATIKDQVLPHIKEIIKSLNDPKECPALKRTFLNVKNTIRREVVTFADQLINSTLASLDMHTMIPIANMAKEYVLSNIVDTQAEQFIEGQLCSFAYPGHGDEL